MNQVNADPMPVAEQPSDEKTGALRLLHASNTGQGITLSSFKVDDPAGSRMLVQATLMPVESIDKALNTVISLVDWYAHDAGRAGDNGEYEGWTRIVLFTADGKTYSCGSRGIAKALAVFSIARKSLHFDPPIKCKVEKQTLAGGKSWLTLIPDLDTLCPAPPKSAGGKAAGK